MRRAQAESTWRALRRRDQRGLVLHRFTYREVEGLGSGSIEFESPITAICGNNGAGKTTMLQSLHAVLRNSMDPSANAPLPYKVRNGEFTIALSQERLVHFGVASDSLEMRVSGQRTSDPLALGVIYLDPSADIPLLRGELRNDADVAGLLEGLEPQALDDGELEIVSALVGKYYNVVDVFEVEEYAAFSDVDQSYATEDGIMPFFRVESSGVVYDSRSMGLGELSLLFTYWALKRVKPNSLVLLEEPEQYVSPRSQRHLLDYLALRCVEANLAAIVTTHSADVLSSLRHFDIKIAIPAEGGVELNSASARSEYLLQLGVNTPKLGLILVEDPSARGFLLALLEHYSAETTKEFDVVFCGGVANVVRLLALMPQQGHDLTFCGVLDGDQRNITHDARGWPLLHLCGDHGPDALLKEAAHSHATELAAALQTDGRRVRAILSAIQGEEPHDWLEHLSRASGIASLALVRSLTRVWLLSEANRSCAEALITELRVALYRS